MVLTTSIIGTKIIKSTPELKNSVTSSDLKLYFETVALKTGIVANKTINLKMSTHLEFILKKANENIA
jgi:hypothetical protein